MLERVNLSKALDDEAYDLKVRMWQVALRREAMKRYTKHASTVVVFEGWDAAGKGGAIKRVTETLDPRGYAVRSFAAPAGDEKTHHYLWRFWKALPEPGQLAIFDRSHYGRVLVERVEGFATEKEWKRAYREIVEFESQLANAGILVVKFWLHIDQDEQLRRFKGRELDPFRSYKLTEEDWRNRARWENYRVAVEDMLEKTSTGRSPWTVVAANDKNYARVKVVKTIARAMMEAPNRER